MAKEWVCDNCYTQNPEDIGFCRVCGLTKFGDKLCASVEEKREVAYRYVSGIDEKTETPAAKSIVRGKNNLYFLRFIRAGSLMLWVFSIIELCYMRLTGYYLWNIHQNDGFEILKQASLGLMERGFLEFVYRLRDFAIHCWDGIQTINIEQTVGIVRYPITLISEVVNLEWSDALSRVVHTIDGMGILILVLWMLSLLLTGVIRNIRWNRVHRGSMFVWYGAGALLGDFLILYLSMLHEEYPAYLGMEGQLFAIMIMAQALTMAVVWSVFVLIGLRKTSVSVGTSARHSIRVLSRYKNDVVWGLVMMVAFATVAIFTAAGMY